MVPLDRRRERQALLLLTAAHFSHILDFMILMPLGPVLMRTFGIGPAAFGALVSAYTFSAGLCGLAAAAVLDRFGRRRAVLGLFGGFVLATAACGLAPSYGLLLAARILAGAFGGLVGAQVLALVGDLVPVERRGRALGLVMSGFSLAAVLGVPLGLLLAQALGWPAPFLTLAGGGALLWWALHRVLPEVEVAAVAPGWRGAWAQLRSVALHPNHQRAFALSIVLALAAFCLIPFLSPYLVRTAGLPEPSLPLIYLLGGAFTIVATNVVGRLADRWGALRVFRFGALASIAPALGVTHLGVTPVPAILAVSTAFMMLNSARFVPAMAMITASVEARYRGGFMGLNAALQQLGGAGAVSVSSLLVAEDAAGHITGYGRLGWLSAALVLVAIWLGGRLRPAAPAPVRPVFSETG